MGKNLTIRELKNWFYIKSTIRREKKNPNSEWHKLKLRNNWFGRIYTIVSLREEDTGEEIMVQNYRAMEKMRPINDYLASLDFTEIVFPSIEKIPESRSYLIVYSPMFKKLTIGKIILVLSVIILSIGSVLYFAL
jgi:hypothetical protein